jgi:hypothetical protein
MPFRPADVPVAFTDYNVDRRNTGTDVSLPCRLYLLHQHVQHSLILLLSGANLNGRRCGDNTVVPIITKRVSTISLGGWRVARVTHTSHGHS